MWTGLSELLCVVVCGGGRPLRNGVIKKRCFLSPFFPPPASPSHFRILLP